MLKKLKSIFIEEDTPVQNKVTGKRKMDSTKKSSSKINMKTKQPSNPSSAKKGNKFIDLLLKAIESNNIDGFDYLEFKQSLQSLAKIESDEAKRYQNAFVMATTMGMTKQSLYDSAQRYANVLGDEEKKFAAAFEKQKVMQVTNREKKLKSLQQAIIKKEDQIKALQKEISTHKKELTSLENEMNKAMSKVEATRDEFYSSYHLVLDQIKEDIDKMNSYIV